jgi:hypothetical protein
LIAPVFLKSEARIEALSFLALLVQPLISSSGREQIKQLPTLSWAAPVQAGPPPSSSFLPLFSLAERHTLLRVGKAHYSQ